MLNELQSQQDLTLQLNEHWLLVQEDHKKKVKQLEVILKDETQYEEIKLRDYWV